MQHHVLGRVAAAVRAVVGEDPVAGPALAVVGHVDRRLVAPDARGVRVARVQRERTARPRRLRRRRLGQQQQRQRHQHDRRRRPQQDRSQPCTPVSFCGGGGGETRRRSTSASPSAAPTRSARANPSAEASPANASGITGTVPDQCAITMPSSSSTYLFTCNLRPWASIRARRTRGPGTCRSHGRPRGQAARSQWQPLRTGKLRPDGWVPGGDTIITHVCVKHVQNSRSL